MSTRKNHLLYAKTPSVDASKREVGGCMPPQRKRWTMAILEHAVSISVVQTFSDYICTCNQLQNIATYCSVTLLVYNINYTTTIDINGFILIERFYIRYCCSYLWYTCTMIICSVCYDKIYTAILAIIIVFSVFSVLFSISPNPNHNQ